MANNWTYSDYILLDPGTAKLTQLRLHVQEVSNAIAGYQQQGYSGMSGAKFQLENYLARIKGELKELEQSLGKSARSAEKVFTRGVP